MSSRRPFLLAVDVGTSALKAVLYSREGGVLAAASRRYDYHSPQPGWAEADPLEWWAALLECAGDLREEYGGFEALEVIALTGQMHSAVLLDARGDPLPPTILWLDRRAAAETAELQSSLGLPPYQLNSTYTLPRLLWLARNRPELPARVAHLLWPKDYLRYRLTGEIKTDYTEAGGAALLDWEKLAWAEERLQAAGWDASILPPLCQPEDDGGRLLPEVAERLGLPPGVRLIVGAGDVLALVSGAPPAAGQVTCSLGSSSMVFCPLEAAQTVADPLGRLYIYPLLPYRLLGGVSSTSGAALQWAWRAFYGEEAGFEAAVSGALAAPPGAEGLLFLPFLAGERSPFWNDGLRGAFYGLTLSHGRPHLLRAVMEGVAFSLRHLLEVYTGLDVPPRQIALAGGGAQIGGWPQIFADVCRLPAAIYSGAETVTRGLYAYACLALGSSASFEEALQRTFDEPVWVTPRRAAAEVYDPIYANYRRLAEFADRQLAK